MKKTVYIFMALAVMITGASVVSADQVTVPMVLHYGNSDYSQVSIRNNSGEVLALTVTFNSNVTVSSIATTNTLSGSTSANTTLAKYATWTIMTKDSLIMSSTASIKKAQVVIQTSATEHPWAGGSGVVGGGPVTVGALFIHISAAGDPSGFSFPVLYRTRSWVSSAGLVIGAGFDKSLTVDNWEQ